MPGSTAGEQAGEGRGCARSGTWQLLPLGYLGHKWQVNRDRVPLPRRRFFLPVTAALRTVLPVEQDLVGAQGMFEQ